jgi:hypothetical protein
MDNSEFLSYFSNLTENNSQEQILKNANNIINTITFSSSTPITKVEKYKDYLKVTENPSEDLLYTLRRLIGGITSTGLEFRKGFTLTFSLLLTKYGNDLNMSEILNCIQKEGYVPKNERNFIKNSAMSGKLLLYKTLLSHKHLSVDNLLFICKDTLTLSKSSKLLEESVLVLFNDLFNKIFNGYYSQIKKETKLYEGIFKQLEQICLNKNNLSLTTTNFEFTLYFILLNNVNKCKGFLPTNILTQMFDSNLKEIETPIKKYFDILLSLPIKNNSEFNISFEYLLQLLENINNPKYAFGIWNILIDNECFDSFKKISHKNVELLIYNYSFFLLNKFFIIDYITQIFDDSFFLSLINFNTNKKIKYVITLTDIIIEQLTKIKDKQNIINEYSLRLLNIFGNDQDDKYSPNSFKNLFLFLFNNMTKEQQNKYIEQLISFNEVNNDNDDRANFYEKNSLNEIIFKLSSLKLLFISNTNIDTTIKNKILDFFLMNYYISSPDVDIEFDHIIEERTTLLILSLIKPVVTNGEMIQIPSNKAIKILTDMHKGNIQALVKRKVIQPENYESYMKYYKQLSVKNEQGDMKGKILSKLGLVLLVLYLKNGEDYEQEIEDVIQIKLFKKGWTKMFTEMILNILHKGNTMLGEFAMGVFKKLAKYVHKDGVDVLIDFLKQTTIPKTKKGIFTEDEGNEDIEMES